MLLESINGPQDLKKLNVHQLNILCAEVRSRIVEVVSKNGGHLASSLGAVELIVALHYCLNLPSDALLFDVGHQAYAHKILTGRNRQFNTLRTLGGLSGFPNPKESGYDLFTSGHSSDAVSLALGLSIAGSQRTVAVIGDGSLSGGLCFEGLNNAGHLKKDLLVVLNTNELSISPAVGAVSVYLNKIISQPLYNRFRESLEHFIRVRLPKGKVILKLADKFEKELKGFFIPGMLFEELGFRYFGPLDGHNLELLIPTLKNLLTFKGPILLHVVTKKGKGYPPAEREPVRFHGASSFDIATGKALTPSGSQTRGERSRTTYTDIFRKKIITLAKENKDIVAITAAMPEGTGLDTFRDMYPDRFFDVGIAESHAVCFAVGLAKKGKKPVVAIYSTFLQRAYDQLIESAGLQNLPVVLCLDRAGISGEDGVTHQGVFDLIYLRSIPNLVVMAPASGEEFEAMLEFAVARDKPCAIRYPKSPLASRLSPLANIELGKAEILREGADAAIIAVGAMAEPSIEAAQILKKDGYDICVVNARFIKPLDKELFLNLSQRFKFLVTVEDGVRDGGFGSGVLELLNRPILRVGLPCEFIEHGKREQLLEKYGLDAQGIAQSIRHFISAKPAEMKCRID